MFKPNFKYTDTIVNNLTQIARAQTVILNSPLVPKWEVSLRREALIRSAHSSTAIEGNALSLEEVSLLAQGREIMATRKDRQEVLNYLEALDNIAGFAAKKPYKTSDLLTLHKMITKNTLRNPSDEGVFRNRRVYVGNSITGEVIFEPPATQMVASLLEDFFEWFNCPDSEKLDAVLHAGITHYEIVRIHPFIDGNGRTTRVMAAVVLYRRGFDTKRYFALDDFYDADRRRYYDVLRSIDSTTVDITGWLEYFTEGVALSIKAVKDKVIGLSRNIKILKDRGQVELTDRQMKIVEMIVQKGKITIGSISQEFNITRQAALKEMNKLSDLKVIELKGMGRGAHYVLL
jgi:Fic family protein